MSNNSAIAKKAADTIRFLAADAVQAAESGHPGMPMGMADTAVALWKTFLRHNPADPHWINRDRFVLSAGHGSMLLYSLLHLTGYDLPMEQIKQFRQWDSITPGHPESHLTPGVETTTGPLGAGVSNAVGLAIAEAWLAKRFNRPGFDVIDHFTYAICSDGDLQEGISHEACALAGHLELGKLIFLYDDNGIQIDGSTDLAFTEDVQKRFQAYGWHTQQVDGHDQSAVIEALKKARTVADKPSLIACRTVIGYGSPNKAGTKDIHGSPMGVDEIELTKKALGWPADEKFLVPENVKLWLDATEEGKIAQEEWRSLFNGYQNEYGELAAELLRSMKGDLPEGWQNSLPIFDAGSKMATRAASGKVLEKLVPAIPDLLGGSADLTGSNKTLVDQMGIIQAGLMDGRYIHYGVREHAMAGIMNGLALHGGVIPYGGTFLVFSDYMRGGMRLSALSELRVIYVLTHDSIGLGEDGPTHQPIAQLMALRAIPHMHVFRPAEANETAIAWELALQTTDGPSVLALTRQKLSSLDASKVAGARQGGYVLEGGDEDEAIILATGSEVEIALNARKLLQGDGINARVVSLLSWELFDSQSDEYKNSVLPDDITARVSIEAGATLGWQKYIGRQGIAIGLDHFGASAPYEILYEKFGLTAEKVAAAVKQLI